MKDDDAQDAEAGAADARRPGRAFPDIIAEQLRTLQLQHRAVLTGGSVESIHKMRVATRRLQASLDLLQVKNDPLKVARLKKSLRKWRRALSTVRNYDVFLRLINDESSSRRSGGKAQFATLTAHLQKKRGERIDAVKKYLARVDVIKLASKLGVTLSPIEDPAKEGPRDSDSDAPPRAAEEHNPGPPALDLSQWPDESAIAIHAADRLEQRLAEFQALAAQSHVTTDPHDLHQLRIAAKRLRYLFEIVSELGFGSATQALASLRSAQDKIGDWHDFESLEEEIINTVSSRKFLKRHLTESADLLVAATHLEKKKVALVKKLFPIRVAAPVAASATRLAKALRRNAARLQARAETNEAPAE